MPIAATDVPIFLNAQKVRPAGIRQFRVIPHAEATFYNPYIFLPLSPAFKKIIQNTFVHLPKIPVVRFSFQFLCDGGCLASGKQIGAHYAAPLGLSVW